MINVNSPRTNESEQDNDENSTVDVNLLTPPLTEKTREIDSDDLCETRKKMPKLDEADEEHIETSQKILKNKNTKKNKPKKKRKSLWLNVVNSANDYKTIKNKHCYTQNVKCTELSNVNYCRDCTSGEEGSLCRFLGWRKLASKNGTIEEAGFLQLDDANKEDFSLWEMETNVNGASVVESLRILGLVGDSFDKLIDNEIKIRSSFKNNLNWKRQMLNMRELCDQCNTTIFNGHLACDICGFSVCLKCYDYRVRNLRCKGKLFIFFFMEKFFFSSG